MSIRGFRTEMLFQVVVGIRSSSNTGHVDEFLKDLHCRVKDLHCRVKDLHCRVKDLHCRVKDLHCRVKDLHCRVKAYTAVWRTYTAVWRTYTAVWRTYTAVWRTYTAVWRTYTAVWRTYTAVWRTYTAVWRTYTAVWRTYTAVWGVNSVLKWKIKMMIMTVSVFLFDCIAANSNNRRLSKCLPSLLFNLPAFICCCLLQLHLASFRLQRQRTKWLLLDKMFMPVRFLIFWLGSVVCGGKRAALRYSIILWMSYRVQRLKLGHRRRCFHIPASLT